MNPAWLEDVHFCVTHQLPSTLDGKYYYGVKYPLCQYKNSTWFKHDSIDVVEVSATEVKDYVTCELCAIILEKE